MHNENQSSLDSTKVQQVEFQSISTSESPSDSVNDVEKNQTGKQEQELEEVNDGNNYVFLIFMIFGFGSLLPWNMFLNISFDYYTMFKLRDNHQNATWYSSNFQNSMTISAQIPNLAFGVANIFFASNGDLTYRMKICLMVVQAMVVFTILFIYINTSTWIGMFFVATIISIIVLNAANGLFQNSMFGLASPFPFKYTNAIIIGQNCCGIAVTILAMATKLIYENVQTRALLFFCLSSIVVITCFVLLNFIKKLNFYVKYGEIQSEVNPNNASVESSWEGTKANIFEAFSKSKMQFANIFILFFITLSLFPNICMYVRSPIGKEKYEFLVPENYFMDVATFLNFNLFAFLGSLLAIRIRVPGPNTIWIPVIARFWFVFYFPAANYQPMGYPRHYPVLFESTWLFVINVALLALSSGYLSSLIMMYAPKSHEDPQIQRMAGMLASFFLIFGIVAGLVFSWQIRLFITGYA